MFKPLLHTYNMNLDYARRLVADIGPDKWAFQPAPKMNHPAWVIGHLAATCDFGAGLLALPSKSPADWEKLFGMNSAPLPDAKLYPDKKTLMAALEDGHARTAAALPKLTVADWEKPFPIEDMRGFVPTVGDALVFIFAAHENVHLGQLSAWRRVQGMPAV